MTCSPAWSIDIRSTVSMNCCRGRGKPETLSRADRSAAAGRLRPIGRALFVVFVTQLHQLGSRIGSARAASPSSTALSLSQNRASRVSRATILSHAGRLPMHRSTAIALSGTGCKQCDRPAARITIGRIGIAVHRIICGFDIAGFTSALRSITEVQRTLADHRVRTCQCPLTPKIADVLARSPFASRWSLGSCRRGKI